MNLKFPVLNFNKNVLLHKYGIKAFVWQIQSKAVL